MKLYEELSKEQLISRLKKIERTKYGLIWADKPEEIAEKCIDNLPYFEEDITKRIQSDINTQFSYIIEGDNFASLFALTYSHRKKIDVIYIDPPYNKGNRDFIYNDNYVDKEDVYKHSKWLSFMDKRLKLAKKLMKDDGILFVSIDDTEFAQLKLLCDKIFFESNHLGTITWEKRTKAQNTKTARRMLQSKTEYILVYRNSNRKIEFKLKETKKKIYDKIDEKGPYRLKLVEEMSSEGMRGRNTMIYEIDGIWPRSGKQWKIGAETINQFRLRNDLIIIDRKPFLKVRVDDEEGSHFLPFWLHFFDKETYGTAETGKAELNEILKRDNHNFETVKPLKLIMNLLAHIDKGKNETILDFFAGSGTTGHAVMELNKIDGGNRQFILCTNNENNICEEITFPRIKTIACQNATENNNFTNIRYLKTKFFPRILTDNDKRKFVSNLTELICLAENTHVEIKIAHGKYSIFSNYNSYTAIIFDEDFVEECCLDLKTLDEKKLKIYLFSYGIDYESADFENIMQDYEIRTIPESILNVYSKNLRIIKK